MPALYEEWASNADPTVTDWRPDELDRRPQWVKFLNDTLAELELVLWPTFRNGAWSAGSYDQMIALTEADFRMFAVLDKLPGRGLDTVPETPLISNVCPAHRTWYLKEDGQKTGMEERYRHYDRSLTDKQADLVRTTWNNSLKIKESTTGAGSVTLQFKRFMQRPRPYQMALMMGIPHAHEIAHTAPTPSMSSGHCLQGLIGIGGVFEHFIKQGKPILGDHAEALRQYGTDIGDRRVMAGVHYPSDNVSSWIIALLLAEHVFTKTPAIKGELALAIKQSILYPLITNSDEAAYQPAINKLAQLM